MTAILLFIIGALLIALNLKAIRKDKEKFQSVLHNVSDDIKDYDLEIGKLKKEFAETIMEIQLEIEDLKDKLKAEDKSTEKNVQNVVIEKENKVYKNVESNIVTEQMEHKVNLSENYIGRNYALRKYEKNYINKVAEGYKDDTLIENYNQLSDDYNNGKNISSKNVEIGHIDDKVSEVNDREINNVKIDDIEKFMKKGMSIDHISEELGIGKGEILLIKKLYLK